MPAAVGGAQAPPVAVSVVRWLPPRRRGRAPGPSPVQPKDNFADLLPPVRYDQPAAFGLAPALPGVPGQLAPAPPWPPSAAPWPGQPAAPVAAGQPGSPGAGLQPGGRQPRGAAAQQVPGRLPLVLATLAGLVAVSVLLPVAGAVAALAVLVLLRAGDITNRWLDRRRGRQGRRRSDAITATLFYPWAVCRSVLGSLLLAPLALLCAAGRRGPVGARDRAGPAASSRVPTRPAPSSPATASGLARAPAAAR